MYYESSMLELKTKQPIVFINTIVAITRGVSDPYKQSHSKYNKDHQNDNQQMTNNATNKNRLVATHADSGPWHKPSLNVMTYKCKSSAYVWAPGPHFTNNFCIVRFKLSLIARFMGHGAHLGPTGPRWAPWWPHELCYLGCATRRAVFQCIIQWSTDYNTVIYMP